jgi:hypothetical protein
MPLNTRMVECCYTQRQMRLALISFGVRGTSKGVIAVRGDSRDN